MKNQSLVNGVGKESEKTFKRSTRIEIISVFLLSFEWKWKRNSGKKYTSGKEEKMKKKLSKN